MFNLCIYIYIYIYIYIERERERESHIDAQIKEIEREFGCKKLKSSMFFYFLFIMFSMLF